MIADPLLPLAIVGAALLVFLAVLYWRGRHVERLVADYDAQPWGDL